MSTASARWEDVLPARRSDSGSSLHSSKGRIGVLSFAARSLLSMVIMLGACWPLASVFLGAVNGSESSGAFVALASILGLGGLVYGGWLSTVSTVKRLHDIDQPGWLYVVLMVPVIGGLFFLYVAFKPGSGQDNQFGSPVAASLLERRSGLVGIVLLAIVAYALFFGGFALPEMPDLAVY